VSMRMMRKLGAVWLIAFVQALCAQPTRPTQSELRAFLASSEAWSNRSTLYAIFYYEAQLRPSIRSLLSDTKTRAGAQEMLALIGDSEDVRLLIDLAPAPRRRPLSDHWAYWVVTALLTPRSEPEWTFLRNCALGFYGDRWVPTGAIQTLKLIAAPRSLQILREAQQRSSVRFDSTATAIDYVQSNPQALMGEELDTLADRVANAMRLGKLEEARNAHYNEAGDKVLMDWAYNTGEGRLIYTATFHKAAGLWRLRGLRETLQQFLAPSLSFGPPLPNLPPPPELIPVSPELPPTLDRFLPSVTLPSPPKDATATPGNK
jgi:hypothetical protein